MSVLATEARAFTTLASLGVVCLLPGAAAAQNNISILAQSETPSVFELRHAPDNWPPTRAGRGTATVLITSTIGAIIGGGVGYAASGSGEDFGTVWGVGVSLGSTVGAIVGASVAGRQLAPKQTVLGGALGALPFIVAAGKGNLAAAPLAVLPILGAWLGNTVGQPK